MALSLFALIDAGSFGDIMLSRKQGGIDDNTVYAIKTIEDEGTQEHRKICFNELKLLKFVQHIPFFVQLKYAFETKKLYCFVMEYYPHGNLYKYIKNHRTLTMTEAKICTAEIILAFSYLHKNGIVYRDLKLENILIARDFHILLTDFGLARKMSKHSKLKDEAGTATYFAPEMISRDGYSFEVDWWTLGILLHEMLVGHSPFADSIDSQNSRERILREEPNFTKLLSLPGCSPDLENIIQQLLIKTPEDRLGATQHGYEQVKSHEYFAPLNWTAVKLKKYKCLEELPTDELIQLQKHSPLIELPKVAENDTTKFQFVAPELLKTADDKSWIKGIKPAEMKNIPTRISIPEHNRNVCLLLKPNTFLRTDIETVKTLLKRLIEPKKIVRFPVKSPPLVNKSVTIQRRIGKRSENYIENRPTPYSLRNRITKRRSTVAV